MANFVVVQFDPQARTVDKNIGYLCRQARKHRDALIILPELFLSSYSNYTCINASQLRATLAPLLRIGVQHNLAFVGSLPVKTRRGTFNRGLYINGERIQIKDKKNLFGQEKTTMSPGRTNPLFYYKNIAFCLQICLDIIDPVPSHHATQKGAKLIINPATVSVDFLRTIGKARALENNVTTVFCNRSGREVDGVRYLGRSATFFGDGTEKGLASTEGTIQFII